MDNDQWLSVLKGDKDAFLTFYKNRYQSLFAYGYRLCGNKELTKDCIQEMFLELWNSRNTVNPEVKSSLSYLTTWLRRIISRQARSDSDQHPTRVNPGDPAWEPSYEELLVGQQADEEKKERLRSALSQLSPGQLKIIRLRFFENKSVQEIAEENGITKQTVYNVVYKALVILKQAIGEFAILLPILSPVGQLITSHHLGQKIFF